MKKEATFGTTITRRDNGSYAPVTFFVILNLISSKLQVMLMTEVCDFWGYFSY